MANVDNSTWQNQSQTNRTFPVGSGRGIEVELRICLYVAIFVLSVSGNALVALTIAQNRRMRTLTNVLLLNLSVADLLLTVFCMPFTLIPTLLQDFIFGPVVCVLVRYMQGALSLSFPIIRPRDVSRMPHIALLRFSFSFFSRRETSHLADRIYAMSGPISGREGHRFQ